LNQAPTFAISKVTVTFDAVNAPDKVNSSKLLVASDSDFTTDVQEIPVTIAAGDVDFTVTNPAANKYYKLVFDCASHTGNGFVQISKLVYKAQ